MGKLNLRKLREKAYCGGHERQVVVDDWNAMIEKLEEARFLISEKVKFFEKLMPEVGFNKDTRDHAWLEGFEDG